MKCRLNFNRHFYLYKLQAISKKLQAFVFDNKIYLRIKCRLNLNLQLLFNAMTLRFKDTASS